MGLSVDLELACDNIEKKSKHEAFAMPTDRMDDKKMSETDAAVGLVASTAAAALMDATEKSPNESPIPHVVQKDVLNVGGSGAEPEEGEIPNSEEEANEFEYEAISSDEEYTLRQKIEALEARNSELEKIHSISARSQDAYDLGFGASATLYGSYKPNAPQSLDEKYFISSNKQRKSQFKPLLTAPHSSTHKTSVRSAGGRQSIDAISSGDECIVLSDVGNSTIYRENAKFYERVHHHHSSSSSRRRKHYREHHDRRYSDEERDTAGRPHAKRRGCDMVRAKRRRLKPLLTSSDDDCFEVTSREELQFALNINNGLSTDVGMNRSTLLHKLKAINNKSGINSDQEDTSKKKSATKKRCRNKAKSRNASVHVSIGDGIGFDEQAIDDAIIDAIFVDGNHVDREPTEDDDGVDEAVSLEEQELRLIALKSAVMKKHEARKKRQLYSFRAYSPTDSLLTPLDEDGACGGDGDGGDDSVEMANQIVVIDDNENNNNNMDISPASSPGSNLACQPMDMDLVSSNDDDSQSPVTFSALPQEDVFHAQPTNEHYVSWMYGIPLVRNPNYNHFLMPGAEVPYNNTTLPLAAHEMGQNQLPCEAEVNANGMAACVLSMVSEEENSLRARLIADLNYSESKKKTANAISPNAAMAIVGASNADAEDVNLDESLEADCLRSLLLSSIKHKKSRSFAIDTTIKGKKSSQSTHSMMDLPNLPKITSNLKEAVKRFQNKNKPKPVPETMRVNVPRAEKAIASIDDAKSDSIPVELTVSANSNAMTPVDAKSPSVMVAMATLESAKKSIVPSVPTVAPAEAETEASAKKTPTIVVQKVIASVAQAPPEAIERKEVAPILPETPATPVTKVMKILTSNTTTDALTARRSPVVLTKETYPAIASSSFSLKNEMLKKSASTSVLPWKPVQKLVISLNADDSSTTEFEDDADVSNATDENSRTNALAWSGMSAEALRAFDNASPASIAMDSPSMAPCSPIDGENSLNALNQTDGDSSSAKDSTKSTDAFQMKLDEYLKQVRAKTDAAPEVLPLTGGQVAIRKPKPAATTQQTEQKAIINIKQKTPVAVCHLPISAQLEYRRLINRMKILEKQKEQKSSQLKQQKMQRNQPTVSSMATDTPFANIRVTLKNENRFIQTSEGIADRDEDQTPQLSSSSSSPPPSPSSAIKLKDSLKKKVLLKNTLTAAAAASNASANESIVVKKRNIESQVPNNNKTQLDGSTPDMSFENPKSIDVEITVLRKTEAKVNAHSKSLLFELEAMLQLVGQTQVEATKQLELEQRLIQLRLQCEAIEEELKCQKRRTLSILPEIVDKQKTIETHKMASRKLTLNCLRLGRKYLGDGYTYHCDNEDQIKNKIKSIQCKTKNLKMLAISVPELSVLVSVDKAQSDSSSSSPRALVTSEASTSGASIDIEKSTSSLACTATVEDNLLISVKNGSMIEDESTPDRVVQQLEGAVIVTENEPSSALRSNSDSITPLNRDEDGSRGKYRSPLDHMQNNMGFSADQSFIDRNAIVCPFDLMGTCDDEKCLYRHLSS